MAMTTTSVVTLWCAPSDTNIGWAFSGEKLRKVVFAEAGRETGVTLSQISSSDKKWEIEGFKSRGGEKKAASKKSLDIFFLFGGRLPLTTFFSLPLLFF